MHLDSIVVVVIARAEIFQCSVIRHVLWSNVSDFSVVGGSRWLCNAIVTRSQIARGWEETCLYLLHSSELRSTED